MSIKVSQAFERTSANPIDVTLALTKAQMLTVNDNLMPDYYFTICQDDGKIYLYDKTATASLTTGKFTEFAGGGGGGGGGSEVFSTTATLDADINDTTTVLAADLPGVSFSDITVGITLIRDAKGTIGLVTAKNGTTDVTVTTATTSTPTKELTQAEYDALTEAEKKNGTIYFITDNYVGSTYVGAYDTIYSTTERVVGSWMGKPMYQKTVECGTLPNNNDKRIAHNIANIDKVVKVTGVIMSSNGFSMSLPAVYTASEQGRTTLFQASTTDIILSNAGDMSMYTGYATICYTKTTDSASPVEYASPNDYSTSEKIVGTWIDGKPIYQLTGTITSGITIPGTTTLISNFASTHNLSEFIGYSTTSAYNSGSQGSIDAFGNGSANISVDSNNLNLYLPSTSATIEKITYTVKYTKTS